MQLNFFAVAIHGGEDTEAELNRFLTGHRVIAIDRQFVNSGASSAWSVCVSFDDGAATGATRTAMARRGKVDFRDVLSDVEFVVFARLLALRKEHAEGIPAYAIFTNEQLAEMVQKRATSATGLRAIPGIGSAAPELTSGSEDPHLNRSASMALPVTAGARRNRRRPACW
jgi:hypothetical protein